MKWSNVYTVLALLGIGTGNIVFWYTVVSLIGIEPTVVGKLPLLHGVNASVVLLSIGLIFGRMAGAEMLTDGVREKEIAHTTETVPTVYVEVST